MVNYILIALCVFIIVSFLSKLYYKQLNSSNSELNGKPIFMLGSLIFMNIDFNRNPQNILKTFKLDIVSILILIPFFVYLVDGYFKNNSTFNSIILIIGFIACGYGLHLIITFIVALSKYKKGLKSKESSEEIKLFHKKITKPILMSLVILILSILVISFVCSYLQINYIIVHIISYVYLILMISITVKSEN